MVPGQVDGVSDFKVGQRDFSTKQGADTKEIKADFENAEKLYTNGFARPNHPTVAVNAAAQASWQRITSPATSDH